MAIYTSKPARGRMAYALIHRYIPKFCYTNLPDILFENTVKFLHTFTPPTGEVLVALPLAAATTAAAADGVKAAGLVILSSSAVLIFVRLIRLLDTLSL